MIRAGLTVLAAYAIALLAAFIAGWLVRDHHPLLVAFIADVAATVVIFGFSVRFRNSSFYDPYWSVAPLPILLYFAKDGFPARLWLLLLLLSVWGARLTYNWWRRWRGLEDEDWRYRDLNAKTGRFYWAVSFLGIHLFPTVMVFLGCMPLWAIANTDTPLNLWDACAFCFTAAAIAIEAVADEQLHRHATGPKRAEMLASGLWALSRHPNYLGEIMLWWGVFFFALAAGLDQLWWWSGPLAMTALFLGISIPMVEKRCRARRPEYRAYAERTSMLIPWPPKR
jgi:steroid 5-alpha reductase family enzyme